MLSASFLLSLVCLGSPVTFIVSPDTHFTQCGGVFDTEKNKRGIAQMNTLEGEQYPSPRGGSVKQIQGVIIPGDLVDDGCNPSTATESGCAEQLGNYTKAFGVHPGEGLVKFPSFDGVGNHDGGNSTDPKFGLVRQEVIARNKRRDPAKAGITNYSLSANSLHYSWDWDGAAAAENVAKDGGGQEGGLHMAMLNVYPGTDGDCASGTGIAGTGCSGAPWGWHSPEHSLEFLIQDLAKLQPKNKPTILFMHYGMKGFGSPGTVPWGGYSPDFWWSAREATAFAKAIAPYNIVAIVHGHTHACVFYNWNVTAITGKVYPVFNAPALQKGGPNDPQTTPSQFLTFEVDPAEGDLRVYQRVGAAWGTVKYEGKFAGGGGGSDESTGGSSGAGVGVAAAGRPEVPAVVGTTSVIAEEPPVVHLSVTV